MPNHVTNDLIVEGNREAVLEFHKIVTADKTIEGGGIVRAFLPFPEELEGKIILDKNGNEIARTFSSLGYQWCIDNWGTKWGDYETDVLSEPHGLSESEWSVNYRYLTAWTPANEAILTISTMQPNLLFTTRWTEEGNQSAGVLVCKNGYFCNEVADPSDHPKWPEDLSGPESECEIEEYYGAWESMVDELERKALMGFQRLYSQFN